MALRETETAAPLVPSRPTLKKLELAAAGCQACDLWKTGTQTVFGEGKQISTVMFIGGAIQIWIPNLTRMHIKPSA